MLIGSLSNTERFESLHPLFKEVFEYVKTHDLASCEVGRITLRDVSLYINIDEATLRSIDEQMLEVHRRYIDIHIPLSGEETVGWRDISTLTVDSTAPFDKERDFAFYAQPAAVYFTVKPGDFYIMYPEDAHAPIIGSGKLRKAVVKVLL